MRLWSKRGGTCGSPGIGRKHCHYQFRRYKEGDGLEGQPCCCAGGVGTDAVHGCEMFMMDGEEERNEYNIA